MMENFRAVSWHALKVGLPLGCVDLNNIGVYLRGLCVLISVRLAWACTHGGFCL